MPLSSFIEIYIEVEDVNDNAPQTSEPVYYPEIMENSPKDVSVVQIEAFDPDSSSNDKLMYKITSGNPQGFFSIHPKTGMHSHCCLKSLCLCFPDMKRIESKYLSVADFSSVLVSHFPFELVKTKLYFQMIYTEFFPLNLLFIKLFCDFFFAH